MSRRKTVETNMVSPAREQDGQAMVEFALVMPILALLTFGTIEVAIYLQQQSAINATAFIAARSGAVVANNKSQMMAAAKAFTDATGYSWLKDATIKPGRGSDLSSFTVTAGADRFSGLISGFSEGRVKGFDKLVGQATLSMEYDGRAVGKALGRSYGITTRPSMLSMADYTSKLDAPGVLAGGRKVFGPLDKFMAALEKLAAQKPNKPDKPGGGGKPDKPGDKPSGGGTQPGVKLPDLKGLGRALAAMQRAPEPFSTRGAVQENPHHEGHGAGSSNHYVSPTYEIKGDAEKYKIADILKDMDDYEQALKEGGVEPTFLVLGKIPQVKPLLGALKPYKGRLSADVEKVYTREYKRQRSLFGR